MTKKQEEAFTAHETAELGVMCLAVGKEKLIEMIDGIHDEDILEKLSGYLFGLKREETEKKGSREREHNQTNKNQRRTKS